MPFFVGSLLSGLADLLLKFFGKKGAKMAFFAVYTALLIAVLNGVKDVVVNNFDISSFMTPTICYFLNRLNAFGLLSTYIAFISANWLKSKTVQFWTSGN